MTASSHSIMIPSQGLTHSQSPQRDGIPSETQISFKVNQAYKGVLGSPSYRRMVHGWAISGSKFTGLVHLSRPNNTDEDRIVGWRSDWKDVKDKKTKKTTEVDSSANHFEDLTLPVFENGFHSDQIPNLDQISLSGNAGDLAGAVVLIMHPRYEEEVEVDGKTQMQYQEKPLYEDELKQVKDKIKEIIPTANFIPEYLYTKPTPQEIARGTVAEFRGAGMLEYAPKIPGSKKRSRNPQVRLTFEDGGNPVPGQSVRSGGPFTFEIIDNPDANVGGQIVSPMFTTGAGGNTAPETSDPGEGPSGT